MINAHDALARCEQITNTEAKNFAYGIRLLPRDKRLAMCAVYAMARRIDDVGDGDLPAIDKLDALDRIRKDVADLPGVDDDPVLVGLADVARRFDLPLSEFDRLISGCEMDVRGTRYNSFDELVEYCRLVAGSIGQLSLGVFGTRYPESAVVRAEALGIALQLTNILRDVVEDRAMGRVYLPLDEAHALGCAPDLTGPHDAVVALVRAQIPRAQQWFSSGLELLPLLDRRSRACVAAMAGIYHRLLERIAAQPDAVLVRRVSLPATEKLLVAARSLSGLGA